MTNSPAYSNRWNSVEGFGLRPVKTTLLLVLLLVAGMATAETKTASKKKTVAHHSAAHSRSAHTRKTASHTSSKAHSRKSHLRGQSTPDSDRTREIQTALIREHYLTGAPSGSWDADTRAAMTRYQSDHGWQSKVVPDSRALIKLGLGPSREGLLNPDTAAISPHELGAENPQPGGSASN